MVSFTILKMASWILDPANRQKQGSATPATIDSFMQTTNHCEHNYVAYYED